MNQLFIKNSNLNKVYSLLRTSIFQQQQPNFGLNIKKYSTNVNGDKDWITIPSITVCGVGGGGSNSVNNMISKELCGVDFIVANTDAQALAISGSKKIVQLGKSITKGLGAGAVPEIGKKATEESIEELMNQIGDTQLLFVTAGLGGGTGTLGASVVASAAKAKGILTVGIVTKPFHFEGKHRMRLADQGLTELENSVDSLIVIPNQKLMENSEDLYIGNAFQMVDDVLYNGIKGISDILVKPGLINLDFADVKSIMCNSGKALMGVGEAEGKGRGEVAALMALNNPLLENIDISGAKGVLLNVTGNDLKLHEVDQIVSLVSSKVDPMANIIFGSSFDQQLDSRIRVTLIVTGMSQTIREQQHQRVQQSVQQPIPQTIQQTIQQQPQQPQQSAQLNSEQITPNNIFSANIKNTQEPHPLNQNLYPYQQYQQQAPQPQQFQQAPQPQQYQQQQQQQFNQFQQPIQQHQQFNQFQQPIQEQKQQSRFMRKFSDLFTNSKPDINKNTTPGSNYE
ncbi:hypothetical protein DICPUDRAFT_99758 [Dictyostelium purpureum]|uniref:Mitochondrial cell division protein n=1 Tax=Dictyostelium purpureum TaxID=5786 RepID=F1A287_DICPU|nr:uncharacterized protein DICPUDRAFT_99758 [Dictyostelium purpureum]EGC29699.1 hypothetical protein DICPUDRAFT_99758 [Dictyostelium purpureum]|eukprot:XP_003293781.1 hypothetical protein DICPUDRAFT_99758 [Dictyostelium purpureum]